MPSIAATSADSFRILPGRADAGLLILCDHAANAFPEGYGTLGLPAAQLKRHIAYDIGAAAIAEKLSVQLNAPAVLSRFSRLLIDPNRGIDDPTLIMRLSDGAVVPGNKTLPADERAKRIERYYAPYHAAIEQVIETCLAAGKPPAVLSIHSFTESWKGVPRPWHVGILWDKDPRLAAPLLEGFYAGQDIIVGDNEPYKGSLRGDCCWQHGTNRGLAHAIIEYRQDLVRDDVGQEMWAGRTVAILRALLESKTKAPQLHWIEHFGSLSDPRPRQRKSLNLSPGRENRP